MTIIWLIGCYTVVAGMAAGAVVLGICGRVRRAAAAAVMTACGAVVATTAPAFGFSPSVTVLVASVGAVVTAVAPTSELVRRATIPARSVPNAQEASAASSASTRHETMQSAADLARRASEVDVSNIEAGVQPIVLALASIALSLTVLADQTTASAPGVDVLDRSPQGT